jgi:putative membrane protein
VKPWRDLVANDSGVRKFLWTWLAIAVAIGLTAWLLPGVDVKGGFFALLLIAAVFGLVNAVIGRILKLLTLPLTLMTLGLFSLVINALMLMLTAWWLDRLDVDGFLTALVATLLISLFSTVAQMIWAGNASRTGGTASIVRNRRHQPRQACRCRFAPAGDGHRSAPARVLRSGARSRIASTDHRTNRSARSRWVAR